VELGRGSVNIFVYFLTVGFLGVLTDALEVSMDHLVGEGMLNGFDKITLKRFQELEHLEDDKKKTLFDLIDTYIRDVKARKDYEY
jgi:hypothetical protein